MLKNKPWAIPLIKNHKKQPRPQTDETTDRTGKSRTHIFKFLTSLTPPVEKIVNLQEFK